MRRILPALFLLALSSSASAGPPDEREFLRLTLDESDPLPPPAGPRRIRCELDGGAVLPALRHARLIRMSLDEELVPYGRIGQAAPFGRQFRTQLD